MRYYYLDNDGYHYRTGALFTVATLFPNEDISISIFIVKSIKNASRTLVEPQEFAESVFAHDQDRPLP